MTLRTAALSLAALATALGCGFNDSFREYLNRPFWYPMIKDASAVLRRGVGRVSVPYAGMTAVQGDSTLDSLRRAYQAWDPMVQPAPETAVAARDESLAAEQKEEVALLDAKIQLRVAENAADREPGLRQAERKLRAFLRTAGSTAYLSEARGWLARIYYLRQDRSTAAKMYLDELNRPGSNLSEQTLINSVRITLGYDGGPYLAEHIEDFFDTPEHAIFALTIVTNPRQSPRDPDQEVDEPALYRKLRVLFERHADLFRSDNRGSTLAMLSLRAALRMGEPRDALTFAAMVPADAPVRRDPDFLWMLSAAHFLSQDYRGAEQPLLELFASPTASASMRSASAYGLCGVYFKTANPVEQIRFALWIMNHAAATPWDNPYSIYFPVSGFDLAMLLDTEAPDEALEIYLARYPGTPHNDLIRYALAVRLARQRQFRESAEIYASLGATVRNRRMLQLAALQEESQRDDLTPLGSRTARLRLAEFLARNSDRVFFNDRLWNRLQTYALRGETDVRYTSAERTRQLELERTLREQQEERWQAYLLMSEVAHEAPGTEISRSAARGALNTLGMIHPRFGHESEIEAAIKDLIPILREPLRRQ